MSYSRLLVGDKFGTVKAELQPEIEFVNWRLNNIGQCKFSMSTKDPKATETLLSYGNRVLLQFENGLPNFGGVIDPPRSWQDGKVWITVYSPDHIFKTRFTDKGRYFSNSTIGGIFTALIQETNAIENTGVELGEIFNDGDSHSPEYHLKSLFEIFQKSLTDRMSTYDFEFAAGLTDGKITFAANLYESKGSDKSGTPLIQGANLAPFKLKEQGPIVNSWTVAGEGTDWGSQRLTSTAEDTNSIEQFGFRQGAKVYGDVSIQGTLDNHAATQLTGSKDPYNIFTVTALDNDPAKFASYDIGDVVSLLAPDFGFGGTDTTIRILSREFSPRTGECDLVVQEVM